MYFDLEESFVNNYINPLYRDRLLFEFKSSKKRLTAIMRFSHNIDSLVKENKVFSKLKDKRARELDFIVFACADTTAEAQALAHLKPDIINPEPSELIGGNGGQVSDMSFVKDTIDAIKSQKKPLIDSNLPQKHSCQSASHHPEYSYTKD